MSHRIKSSGALRRLGTDDGGLISFEYVAVAAIVVATVSAVFKAATAGPIMTALTSTLNRVGTAVSTFGGG